MNELQPLLRQDPALLPATVRWHPEGHSMSSPPLLCDPAALDKHCQGESSDLFSQRPRASTHLRSSSTGRRSGSSAHVRRRHEHGTACLTHGLCGPSDGTSCATFPASHTCSTLRYHQMLINLISVSVSKCTRSKIERGTYKKIHSKKGNQRSMMEE